jgi:hypothetical protein
MEFKEKNNWLQDFKMNVTSSHGEDGMIAKIFEIIGEDSRWCVELGALNGKHDSNVWSLIKEKGWNGVLIEADPTYFEKLVAEYKEVPTAHPINKFVSFEGDSSLDTLFSGTPLPKEFDLFSLDIDGNDYHLWDSLSVYRPRVMVIEFNPSIPTDVSFIQPRDMSVYQGSSLRAIVELGKKKGYELIATNEANAFFVKEELFPKFGIEDNSIETLRTDRQFETKLYQLYDGTLMLSGNTKLLWHGKEIDQKELQVIPSAKRKYPARISPSGAVRAFKYVVRTLPFYSRIQKLRKKFS